MYSRLQWNELQPEAINNKGNQAGKFSMSLEFGGVTIHAVKLSLLSTLVCTNILQEMSFEIWRFFCFIKSDSQAYILWTYIN